jgi:hypothetical protein
MPDVISTASRIARAYHRLGLGARGAIGGADSELKAALDELMELPVWQINPAEAVEAPRTVLRRLPSNAARLMAEIWQAPEGPDSDWAALHAVLKLVDSWTDNRSTVSYLPEDEPVPFLPVDEEAPEPTLRITDVRALIESSGVPAPTDIDDPWTSPDTLPAHILAWLSDVVGVLRGYRIIHEQDMLGVGMGKS